MYDIIINIILVLGVGFSSIIIGKELLRIYRRKKRLNGYPSLYDMTDDPESLGPVLGWAYVEWMKGVPVKPWDAPL